MLIIRLQRVAPYLSRPRRQANSCSHLDVSSAKIAPAEAGAERGGGRPCIHPLGDGVGGGGEEGGRSWDGAG